MEGKKAMKTVLLLGDITGRSRVALRMLSTVLEDAGHDVLMLPTALISNTLNLGRHEALDTTDYLVRSLRVWEDLGIHIDMAYIGYITGMEQARRLAEEADRLRGRGIPVIVDPILGDNGKKYLSVTQEQAEGMKLLCAHADLITPNLTEACLLSDVDTEHADAEALCGMLASDTRSVLITSAKNKEGSDAILGFDAKRKEAFSVPFERVPGHHWGTGDLFTGLLMDGLLRGGGLKESVACASARVCRQLQGEERSLLPEQ